MLTHSRLAIALIAFLLFGGVGKEGGWCEGLLEVASSFTYSIVSVAVILRKKQFAPLTWQRLFQFTNAVAQFFHLFLQMRLNIRHRLVVIQHACLLSEEIQQELGIEAAQLLIQLALEVLLQLAGERIARRFLKFDDGHGCSQRGM